MRKLTHILSVDDNLILQDIHKMLLTPFAERISIAMSGAEAITKVSQERFDLILLDVQMPVMNGLETARAMRAQGITTPIIAVTGNNRDEDRQLCREAGMNGYVPKPLDEAVLMREIERLLS